jgi:flagellar motor switch protein FliG
MADLAIALVGAESDVKKRLLQQMRPRERANLRENVKMLGPVSKDRTDRQRARRYI